MTRIASVTVILLCCTLLRTTHVVNSAEKPDSIVVQGFLFDSEGHPIPGARVLVGPTRGVGGQFRTQTDNRGWYSMRLNGGAPFTIIYSTQQGQVSIDNLSGKSGQEISKVILNDLDKSSTNDIQDRPSLVMDLLQSFEFLLFKSQAADRHEQFAEFLAEEKIVLTGDTLNELMRAVELLEGERQREVLAMKVECIGKTYRLADRN